MYTQVPPPLQYAPRVAVNEERDRTGEISQKMMNENDSTTTRCRPDYRDHRWYRVFDVGLGGEEPTEEIRERQAWENVQMPALTVEELDEQYSYGVGGYEFLIGVGLGHGDRGTITPIGFRLGRLGNGRGLLTPLQPNMQGGREGLRHHAESEPLSHQGMVELELGLRELELGQEELPHPNLEETWGLKFWGAFDKNGMFPWERLEEILDNGEAKYELLHSAVRDHLNNIDQALECLKEGLLDHLGFVKAALTCYQRERHTAGNQDPAVSTGGRSRNKQVLDSIRRWVQLHKIAQDLLSRDYANNVQLVANLLWLAKRAYVYERRS
eukprot:sb/3466739/